MIKKKESVMTLLYMCSDNCKSIRKATLPKRLSNTCWQYWVNQGFTESEARKKVSELQSSRSPRTVQYWVSRGFTELEAKKKVSELQSSLSKLNIKKYSKEERQIRSPFSKYYWIQRGYSEADASQILSKASDTTSLSYFIARYGENDGGKLHADLCNHRKKAYTLAGFVARHGHDEGNRLWSKKFKNRHNSKKATEFFKKLSALLSGYKIYTAGNENGEYGVLDKHNNKYYFYDFVVPELNFCVEYHGDYWHCNPEKYSADFFHVQSQLSAREIWESDKIKQTCLLTERNIPTIVVWESADTEKMLTLIVEKIDEFRKS
jgi:hypothetical protein